MKKLLIFLSFATLVVAKDKSEIGGCNSTLAKPCLGIYPVFKDELNVMWKMDEEIAFRNDTKRVGIVIISSYRTGSTFLGEIFNHHPKVFYHFEPLAAFQNYEESKDRVTIPQN